MTWARLACLAAIMMGLVGLNGCAKMPRPFMHDGPHGNALIEPGLMRGLDIKTVENLPHGPELAVAMASNFQSRDIPASTGLGNPGSLVLNGEMRAEGPETLSLTWWVTDPDQRVVASHAGVLDRATWNQATPDVINGFARNTVAALASMLREEVEQRDPNLKPSIFIAPIEAPGDGARALTLALSSQLRALGYPLTDEGAADAVLRSTISLTPADKPGSDRIALAWRLENAAGKQLGLIEQENIVPAGLFRGSWGADAFYIAEGVVSGLLEVLHLVEPAAR